jgi:hypothetical protein
MIVLRDKEKFREPEERKRINFMEFDLFRKKNLIHSSVSFHLKNRLPSVGAISFNIFLKDTFPSGLK